MKPQKNPQVYACHLLYNRTHHSGAIDQTPYEAFTGLKPGCSHILTYRCTITEKKPSCGTPKADPNTYKGIRERSTCQNLKYHNIHSHQRRKWAHHLAMDESQYGDEPQDRSVTSKYIPETFTQILHSGVCGKKLLQPKKPDVVDPISQQPDIQTPSASS